MRRKFHCMATDLGSVPQPITDVPHVSRPAAIAQLREKLASLVDTEHCVCAVAERLGFPCRGFAQLSDEDFRRRFDWIAKARPGATRKELEEYANLYLLGRQAVTGAAIALRRRNAGARSLRRLEHLRQSEARGVLPDRLRPPDPDRLSF